MKSECSGTASCADLRSVSTEFHEKFDFYGRIAIFIEICSPKSAHPRARGPLVRRFEQWAPNFIKIAIRP